MNTLDELRNLHLKFSSKYKGNTGSKKSEQMCCMWSTSNPPSDIYNTDQMYSIQETFNIQISEDDALDIYDMDVVDAAIKLDKLIVEQSVKTS